MIKDPLHEVASLRSDLNAAPGGEAMIAILNQPPRHVCECGCAAALRQRVEELERERDNFALGRLAAQERAEAAEAEVERLKQAEAAIAAWRHFPSLSDCHACSVLDAHPGSALAPEVK